MLHLYGSTLLQVNIIADYSLRHDVAEEEGIEDPSTIPESRIGAAVIECSVLANYADEDWTVTLDKPELVFSCHQGVSFTLGNCSQDSSTSVCA